MARISTRLTRASSVTLCALLLVGVPACFGEEGDAATTGTSAVGTGPYAGFTTCNDVSEHAKIDLDIKAIQEEMGKDTAAGWTEATSLYENGKMSSKGGTPEVLRTLKGMSLKIDEPFGKLYTTYETATKISPHKVVAAALAGTDSADYGNFATGPHANTTDFRTELIKKTLKVCDFPRKFPCSHTAVSLTLCSQLCFCNPN